MRESIKIDLAHKADVTRRRRLSADRSRTHVEVETFDLVPDVCACTYTHATSLVSVSVYEKHYSKHVTARTSNSCLELDSVSIINSHIIIITVNADFRQRTNCMRPLKYDVNQLSTQPRIP